MLFSKTYTVRPINHPLSSYIKLSSFLTIYLMAALACDCLFSVSLTSSCDVSHNNDGICSITLPILCHLVGIKCYYKNNSKQKKNPKTRQGCPDDTFIDRRKRYFLRSYHYCECSFTLPENLNSHLDFSGVRVTRSLCVCFVDCCLSFCSFSFDHCVVCSSIYGF